MNRLFPVGLIRLSLWVACLVFAGTVLAGASGVVVDSKFFPLPGAEACLVEGEETGPCVLTDGGGEYVLPDSEMSQVRITLKDYIPVFVAAVDHVKPVMLQHAAILVLFAVDGGNGEFLGDGKFWITRAGGDQTGPFPVSPGGTRVKSLSPGRIAIHVEVPGFRQESKLLLDLEAGNETKVEVRLARISPAK